MGRIVITPAAVLFTTTGQRSTLRAEAFDAAGKRMDAAVTWESSRPQEVVVDATGQVTSMIGLGSSQIRARAGGLVSSPVLVLVAEPAAGAVLVSDAQVLSGPTPADPMAAPGIGTRMKLTITRDTPLEPGTILLAAEGKPVGGRVVSAVAGATGGQLEVVLEAVPLLALFKRLRAEGSYAVNGAAMAEALAAPPRPTMAGPPSRPGEIGRISRSQIVSKKFMLGPLECEAKVVGGALTGDATLKLVPDLTFNHLFLKDADENWSTLMVKLEGTLTVQVATTLSFSPMLAGSVACDVKLVKIPLPIGGPLAAVVSFQVPLGVKAEISAALMTNPLAAGLELNGQSRVQMGFLYTPATGPVDLADFSNKFELTPTFTYPENDTPFLAVGSVALGGTAGLSVGITPLTLLGIGSYSLIEAALLMKAEMKLGGARMQFAQPDFASEYDVKPVLEAGAGEDAKKALEWFGGAIALKPTVTIELPPLAQSPRGTLKAERTTVPPGEPVKLTVTLDPMSLSFLGVDNVTEVRIYQAPPGMEFKLAETISASPGQTSFTWSLNTSIIDTGTHRFWATATSKLAPGLPLEVSKKSDLDVHVGARIRWRGTVTCTRMGQFTDSYMGTTTKYSTSSSVTVKAEHETDLAVQTGGVMKITGLQATYSSSVIMDYSSGGACPEQFHSELVESATTSAPSANDLALLVVSDERGQYIMQVAIKAASGAGSLTTTRTISGDPIRCRVGTMMMTDPRGFSDSWHCAAPMGMFTVGKDEISGSSMDTEGTKPPITSMASWQFQRI